MPTKPGAGGQPQNYGAGGKYAATPRSPLPNGADPEVRAKVRMRNQAGSRISGVEREMQLFRDSVNESSEVRIRVPKDVLHLVLQGGFRTQHDTGTSRGDFSPDVRDSHELAMFNAALTRPIYGYVSGLKEGWHSAYGEFAVVLKRDVRERTTVTMGDSLNTYDPPAPVRVNDVSTVSDERLRAAATEPYMQPSYMEAQIHGGVSPSDIDRIIVPARYEYLGLHEQFPQFTFEYTDAGTGEFTMLDLLVMPPTMTV